jgi:hypothetical protein
LLLQAANKLDEEHQANSANFIRASLELGEDDAYLRAAQIAQKKLGNDHWHSFLTENLALHKSQCESNSLSNAGKVWRLGSQLLITTNYDKVLDWSCPDNMREDIQHRDIEAAHGQSKALTKPVTHPTVWHLHGRIANVDKLILAPNGYKALYGGDAEEQKYKAALISLRMFLATRTLLFIGFSFDDEDFYQQLKHMNDIFDGNTPKHYVLVRKDQEQKIKDLKLPLHPVTYDNHEDLPQLLEELACFVDIPNEITIDDEIEQPKAHDNGAVSTGFGIKP